MFTFIVIDLPIFIWTIYIIVYTLQQSARLFTWVCAYLIWYKSLSLKITKELSRLQKLALANKLDTDDISGGTFTLSNIGAIGGKYGSPLINSPEVAIIAIGRIQKIPQFTEDGNVYPASILTVSSNWWLTWNTLLLEWWMLSLIRTFHFRSM